MIREIVQGLTPQAFGAVMNVRRVWHRRPRLNLLLTVLVLIAGLMLCPWVHAAEFLGNDSGSRTEADLMQDASVSVNVKPEGNGSIDGNLNAFERKVDTDSSMALELEADDGNVIGAIRVNGEALDDSDLTNLLGNRSGKLTLEDVEEPLDLEVIFMTKEEYGEAKAGMKSSGDSKQGNGGANEDGSDGASVNRAADGNGGKKSTSAIDDAEGRGGENDDVNDAEDIGNSWNEDFETEDGDGNAGGSGTGSDSDDVDVSANSGNSDEGFEGPDDAMEGGDDGSIDGSVESAEGTDLSDSDSMDDSAGGTDSGDADGSDSSKDAEDGSQESVDGADPGQEEPTAGESGEAAADAGIAEESEGLATIQVGKGVSTKVAEEDAATSKGGTSEDVYSDTPRTGDSFPTLCLLLLAASLTMIGILACGWLRRQRG